MLPIKATTWSGDWDMLGHVITRSGILEANKIRNIGINQARSGYSCHGRCLDQSHTSVIVLWSENGPISGWYLCWSVFIRHVSAHMAMIKAATWSADWKRSVTWSKTRDALSTSSYDIKIRYWDAISRYNIVRRFRDTICRGFDMSRSWYIEIRCWGYEISNPRYQILGSESRYRFTISEYRSLISYSSR